MIVGIDEVGRGPIAGPVTVCAVLLKKRLPKKILETFRDSKKLSPAKREEWFFLIEGLRKRAILDYCVASVSAKTIDRIGIAPSIRRALAKTLSGMELEPAKVSVRLDGSLKAPLEYTKQKTIIKGDEKEPSIALASIVAKVTRDRYMIIQGKKYPEYFFETHKGYGTRRHYDAVKKSGCSPLHRQSFLKSLTNK